MPQEQSNLKERQRTDIREPKCFKVILHNDDFTTMDFVVKVLKQVFFLTGEKAEALMMKVHKEGKAVVGLYTYDIAASKARRVSNMAREEGSPLRVTIEPEDN